MSQWGSRLPAWLRPPVYTVGASILLLGAAALVNQYLSHELYAALYLYLPLMAVNTIFTYRAGGFSVTNRPVAAAGGRGRLLPGVRPCHLRGFRLA